MITWVKMFFSLKRCEQDVLINPSLHQTEWGKNESTCTRYTTLYSKVTQGEILQLLEGKDQGGAELQGHSLLQGRGPWRGLCARVAGHPIPGAAVFTTPVRRNEPHSHQGLAGDVQKRASRVRTSSVLWRKGTYNEQDLLGEEPQFLPKGGRVWLILTRTR